MSLHSIAAVGAERLLYSVAAGTLLAVVVWLVLRLFPHRNSRTSFVVWFGTLLATAVLPWVGAGKSLFTDSTVTSVSSATTSAVLTISTTWALVLFGIWAAIALIGLARVAWATVQVCRLHAGAEAIDLQTLDPKLRTLVEEFQAVRPLVLLMSHEIEVPTAIGFFKPAVVLPAWMLEETPAEELQYTLLHEMAHLRRCDDWTNLAQKILKALLFFVPSVWWIERRLSLDREMACDDAVLAHSGNPRGYAECLAHIAEKSFLRRQLALVQAAVSKMRQLTVRVARILEPNRPAAETLWKPALPVVAIVAVVCVFTTSNAPTLVRFADDATPVIAATPGSSPATFVPAETPQANDIKAWPANLKIDPQNAPLKAVRQQARHTNVRLAKMKPENKLPELPPAVAQLETQNGLPENTAPAESLPGYMTVHEELFVVVTQRTTSTGQQETQMNVWQLTVHTPAPKQKPVPRKT